MTKSSIVAGTMEFLYPDICPSCYGRRLPLQVKSIPTALFGPIHEDCEVYCLGWSIPPIPPYEVGMRYAK